MTENPTPAEARAALADLDHRRAALGASMDAPFLRHLAFAVTTAVIALSATSSKLTGLLALGAAGIVLILQWDRKHYGVFVNGYRVGKTLPVTIALAVALLGAIMAAARVRESGDVWLGAGAVAFAFVASLAASYAWQAVYKREMGA